MTEYVDFGQSGGGGQGSSRPGAPSQQSRPASSPAPETRGFGSVPSAGFARQAASSVALPATNTARAGRVLKAPITVGARPPLLVGLFLLGPGARVFHELLCDFAPYLDRESGEDMHWLVMGDPGGSGENFRAFLEAQQIPLDGLKNKWEASLQHRADAAAVRAFETETLAAHFDVRLIDMPLLLLFTPGTNGEPYKIQLPKEASESVELGKRILNRLVAELGSSNLGALRKRVGTTGPEPIVQQVLNIGGAIKELATEFQSDVESESRADLARRLIAKGVSITEAAKRAGVSRPGLYKGDRNAALLEEARERAKARGIEIPLGSKFDGVVDGVDSPEAGAD